MIKNLIVSIIMCIEYCDESIGHDHANDNKVIPIV